MPSYSQTLPDAGSIQRDIERQPVLRPSVVAPQAPPTPVEAPRPRELQFQIKAFVLEGVSLVPEADIQAVLKPWRGRAIQFSDLERAKQAIADLYQGRGWFARPYIPEQELQDDGELRLQIVEGRLGTVRIESSTIEPDVARRIDRDRIERTFTARQQTGDYLHVPHIERAVSLINDTPGMGVNATLAASEVPGATDVVVSPLVRPMLGVTATLDNAGSRSTGTNKVTAALSLDNPAGWGDQTSLTIMGSEGVRYSRLAWSVPLGYDGWRLGLNASSMDYRVIFPMSGSTSYPRGNAATQGLGLSWPVLRGGASNVYFSVGYDQKHFINEIHNPSNGSTSELSNKRLNVGNLAFSGDRSDSWGEGGMTQWTLGWTQGEVDLSGNPGNQQQDQQGIRTQGHYNKLSASLSRLQRLTSSNSLWLSLQGQRSDKNLDSSEKFTLGGAQGVRAYPSAEGSGDHGWQLTVESRQVINPQWQGVLFYDHGRLITNHQNYTGANGPSHVTLKGWGASLNYALPGRLIGRLTWSRRIGDNPLASTTTGLDSDGSRVIHRVWLSLTAIL